MEILAYKALGGGNGLGNLLAHEGRGESGPSGVIAGVDGLIPGGDRGAKTGVVYINDHILKRFDFVGAVAMCLKKRWIGRWSQRRERYVSEAVGAVAVADNGGSAIFDEANGVVGEIGGVAVITKSANGY